MLFLYSVLPWFIGSAVLSAGVSLLLRSSEVVKFFRNLLSIGLAICAVASLIQWWRWHAMVTSPSYQPPNMGYGEVLMLLLFPFLGTMAFGAVLGAFCVERRFAARGKPRSKD
jgi:hypothetical protein